MLRMGKIITANETTDKGLISKRCKQLIQINTKQKKSQKVGKIPKQTYVQRLTVATKHMNRCSTSLIVREIKIKTTMRYHFIPVRTAIIKKSTNSKCWRRCGEKGTHLHCWWECKLIPPL